jgi:hypothetical protein
LEGVLRLKEELKARAILHDADSSRLIILSAEKDSQCTGLRGARKGIQAVPKAAKPLKTVGECQAGRLPIPKLASAIGTESSQFGAKKQSTFVMPKGQIP